MNNLIAPIIYVAIGMVIYMIFNTFAWSDPWLYVYMGLWPLVVVLVLFLFVLAAVALTLVVLGIIYVIKILIEAFS